jgi:transmembrane sensor
MAADSKISLLFRKYVEGTAVHEERLEFLTLANQADMQAELAALIDAELKLRNTPYSLDDEEQLEVLTRIYKAPAKTPTYPLWKRLAGVAAAVAAIVFGVWFYTYEVASSRKAPRNDVAYKNDVAPGKNTATLTLANGRVISLSDSKTGVVVGADKLAYNDGTVVDPLTGSPNPSLRGGTTRQPHTSDEIAASRNAPRNDVMVSTPRGGTYQITLPDGTHVWLNADSKISFPSQFIGKERRVLLVNGEAYFEVVKVVAPATREVAAARSGRPRNNVRVPFIVESNGQEVEVLGTHFNINAYKDEPDTKTTLLEGSVRVSSLRGGPTRQPHDEIAASRRAPRNDGRNNNYDRNNDGLAEGRSGKSEVLKPSQQAVLDKTFNLRLQTVLHAERSIAWTNVNGKAMLFFDNDDLGVTLRKVARWYNVDVVYQTTKNHTALFSGIISRDRNLSSVIELLEATGSIHLKIEGRKLIVMD